MSAAEQLGDLDRVQGGALADVVGDAPQSERVPDGRVRAHPADISRIFADAFDRGDVSAVLALVDEHDPRRLAEDRLRLFGRNLALELDVDRLAVADEDR